MRGFIDNRKLCEQYDIGENGFYEVTSGTVVRRLRAEVVKIRDAKLIVHVERGNGKRERKEISPKSFVRAS